MNMIGINAYWKVKNNKNEWKVDTNSHEQITSG
jgi:hypothetical protein